MNGIHRIVALTLGIVIGVTCGLRVQSADGFTASMAAPSPHPPAVAAGERDERPDNESRSDASKNAADMTGEEPVDDAIPDADETDASHEANDTEVDEALERPRTPEQELWDEFESLLEELHDLRIALADAELRAKEAEREVTELRQFIEDRDEYGEAYEEYQAMRALRERELREQRMREARERYESEREERIRRMAAAHAERMARRVERREQRQFEDAGFTHLGLNVYVGQMAYTYRKRDTLRTRVRYSPVIGRYLRPEYRDEIDFTEMIISGSVVNASDRMRNVGVAVTFFDERGNQVGNEIVQVNNARPGVPYPFTSTIRMALDRPFTSTTSYVLFADPAASPAVRWQE